MSKQLLAFDRISVEVGCRKILNKINLKINEGELHVLIGRNGDGKSTIAKVLAGSPHYNVVEGSIKFSGNDLLDLKPEQRANSGIFVAFQNPVSIPGVSLVNFLKYSIQAQRRSSGEEPLPIPDLLSKIKKGMEVVGLPYSFISRSLNDGFSGGEKKRVEWLQLVLLQPRMVILDEIDSGLDQQSVNKLSKYLASMHDRGHTFLIITHYMNLFNYLNPDFIHIVENGSIKKTGDISLLKRWIKK